MFAAQSAPRRTGDREQLPRQTERQRADGIKRNVRGAASGARPHEGCSPPRPVTSNANVAAKSAATTRPGTAPRARTVTGSGGPNLSAGGGARPSRPGSARAYAGSRSIRAEGHCAAVPGAASCGRKAAIPTHSMRPSGPFVALRSRSATHSSASAGASSCKMVAASKDCSRRPTSEAQAEQEEKLRRPRRRDEDSCVASGASHRGGRCGVMAPASVASITMSEASGSGTKLCQGTKQSSTSEECKHFLEASKQPTQFQLDTAQELMDTNAAAKQCLANCKGTRPANIVECVNAVSASALTVHHDSQHSPVQRAAPMLCSQSSCGLGGHTNGHGDISLFSEANSRRSLRSASFAGGTCRKIRCSGYVHSPRDPGSPSANDPCRRGDRRCRTPCSLHHDLLVGDDAQLLAGNSAQDYALGKQIGQGSYASVNLGVHRETNRKVAVKIYEKSKLMDPQRRKSVRNEIRIMQSLRHANIVLFYGSLYTATQIYIVMEYVSGGSLHQYLKRRPERRLENAKARRIYFQVCQGMKYLHDESIVHRDVKLENLLLDDTHEQVKIIDFGFSTVVTPGKKLKIFCGTPSYMSPEIVARREYFGSSADVWAMGVLLYAVLCGGFPFRGHSDRELYRKICRGAFNVPDFITDTARQVLHRILISDMQRRPSVDDILSDAWLDGQAHDDMQWNRKSTVASCFEPNRSTSSTASSTTIPASSTVTADIEQERADRSFRDTSETLQQLRTTVPALTPASSAKALSCQRSTSFDVFHEPGGYTRSEIVRQLQDERSYLW